jgi:hypothetical protein
MTAKSELPTTSSALEELKDGQYDIVQLSKKVDEAVNALKSGNTIPSDRNRSKGKKRASGTDPCAYNLELACQTITLTSIS